MERYIVKAVSNYNNAEFGSKAKAFRYARRICDSTNSRASVIDTKQGEVIARWVYTPNNGGRVFRTVT